MKAIFLRYKLLFIVYGLALLFACWELYGVSKDNKRMIQADNLTYLLEKVDEDSSYYAFQIKEFEGRPESDYLKGLRAFKAFNESIEKNRELLKQKKPEAAKEVGEQAEANLVEANRYFQRAIDQGVISNQNLLILNCLTLKLMKAPEEEYKEAKALLDKHFPLSPLPKLLQEDRK